MPAPTFDAPTITLSEARSLIASSGTTGMRTWEAALSLGHFLSSVQGRQLVEGKNVVELGAGTGFLSILCAKYLHARYVLATDGSEEVIDHLKSNVHLNGLGGGVIDSEVFQWGHTLIDSVLKSHGPSQTFDLILSADVVSSNRCENL